jgi:hypothetical protein
MACSTPAVGQLATAGTRVAVVFTCTSAGVVQPRAGLGCGGATTADVEVSRPMLTLGGIAQHGRYQRTTLLATDYDYVGFPMGARFNGINTWMQIPGLDMSASDKALFFASSTKEADTTGFLFELSASTAGNAGSLGIYTSAGNYRQELRGDAATPTAIISIVGAGVKTSIISCGFDIAGADQATEIFPRINGATPSLSFGGSATAGSGNLGNYTGYIGRRGGVSNPFTGTIQRMGLRGGAFDANAVLTAERFANERVKAYA